VQASHAALEKKLAESGFAGQVGHVDPGIKWGRPAHRDLFRLEFALAQLGEQLTDPEFGNLTLEKKLAESGFAGQVGHVDPGTLNVTAVPLDKVLTGPAHRDLFRLEFALAQLGEQLTDPEFGNLTLLLACARATNYIPG
jgi:hypothetical protein